MLASHQSESDGYHGGGVIHSDEGLMLERSVFESFMVANLPNLAVDNLF